MSKPRVRVYITIDTECAEERGTAPSLGWNVRVWGRFLNQERALGIELIMDELARHGTRATFFTEALGSKFFGEDELARVCTAMLARGHDVQLHTHPRQATANFRSLGIPPASDDMADYDIATQASLLEEGVAILARCGVPREHLLAFRAGNYGASNATWEAMARVGLVVSSNYNRCYFGKNCKMRSARASAGLFQAEHGVWELPITTFLERGGGHRHVQITAVSSREIRALLDDAHRAGVTEITIVTHSFELYHCDSVTPPRGRPNTMNVLRLRALCRYLAENSDRFEVDTVGALALRIKNGLEHPIPAPAVAVLRGHDRHRMVRLVEQTYKRIEERAGWSLPIV